MQGVINHSPSRGDEDYATSTQPFYGSDSHRNDDLKIITLMLVAREIFFSQGIKTLLGFYKANPLWQFKIVAEADRQPDVLKLAAQQHPSLILLDMDGHQDSEEAINTIVELNSLFSQRNEEPIKILAISTQRDEKSIFLAMQAGSLGYVLKENLPSQLYAAMLAVFSGQVYLCPEVATQFVRGFHLYRKARFIDIGASASVAANAESCQPYRLTQREQEVLELLVKGYCNKEIAKRLYITIATVKAHLTAIFEKLGVKSRSKAIVRSLELGLV